MTDGKGKRVICTTCGRNKKPRGRDLSPEVWSSWCTDDCEGYRQDPKPSTLFPNEEAD